MIPAGMAHGTTDGTTTDEWSVTDGPVPLLVGARVLGHLAWVERRLHGVLGGWVASTPEPAVAVLLHRNAQHHPRRSAALGDRLPLLRELPRDQLVVAPGPGVEAALDGLGPIASTDARLDATYGVVVPELLAAYRSFVGRLTPVADAPLLRWLPVLERDLAADADAAVAPDLTDGPGHGPGRGDAVAHLRSALAASEGLAGATGRVLR